jgi:threonine/homoserine/homoserine lactone efflux protein
MVLLVGLGVIQVFDYFPLSYDILKVLSIFYLMYLAFKIATSTGNLEQNSSSSKPFTFIQAALFQWVNPKAWTMALTSISIYAPSKSFTAVLLVAIVFGIVNLPCVSSWIILGQKIQVILTDKKRLRVFNITMALLLILSLYPTL